MAVVTKQILRHPNDHAMRDALARGGITGAVSRKHRIDASAAVYGADGVPSGYFDRMEENAR